MTSTRNYCDLCLSTPSVINDIIVHEHFPTQNKYPSKHARPLLPQPSMRYDACLCFPHAPICSYVSLTSPAERASHDSCFCLPHSARCFPQCQSLSPHNPDPCCLSRLFHVRSAPQCRTFPPPPRCVAHGTSICPLQRPGTPHDASLGRPMIGGLKSVMFP